MNPKAFHSIEDDEKESLGDLMQELNSIERDVDTIRGMKVSDEAKKPILAELERQKNEVKERMHNCIDRL